MTIYSYKGTEKEPTISANILSGKIEIFGRSIPEDARAFYMPFQIWMEEAQTSPESSDKIDLKIDLDYLNTSSSKFFLELMQNMLVLANKKDVRIIWVYEEGDDEMMETGLDFKYIIGDILTLEEKKLE